MGNSILRKQVRKIISEFFNNQVVYADSHTKFPKFDGSEKTPSDLDMEFQAEFGSAPDAIEESEETPSENKTPSEDKSKKGQPISKKD